MSRWRSFLSRDRRLASLGLALATSASGAAGAAESGNGTRADEARAAAGRSAAAPADARALLAALAGVSGLEARFVERKSLALLSAPLVSKGRLYYLRPGRMAREIVEPEPSLIQVGPDSLRIIGSSGTQQIDLASRPDVRLFVESFSGVLAGDFVGLSRHYRLTYSRASGSANRWSLELVPRAAPLAHLIRRIEVLGQGLAVSELRVEETRGDKTVTTLTAADAERKFSVEEKRRLFGAPPAPK